MKFAKYPKYIFLIGIVLLIIVIIYCRLCSSKLTEGAQTNDEWTQKTVMVDAQTNDESSRKDITSAITNFTNDLYAKMKNVITTKTQDSESRTDEILKKIETDLKNIEESDKVDPKIVEKWENLNKSFENKAMELKRLTVNPGVSIDILSDTKRDKIKGIINKYF